MMFGHRVAAVLTRFPTHSRLIGAPITSRYPSYLAIGAHSCRFATVGRPRKVDGGSSRAVKSSAKSVTSKSPRSSSSTKKVAKKKTKKVSKSIKATKKPTKPKKVRTDEQEAALQARKAAKRISGLKKAALKTPSTAMLTAHTVFSTEFAKRTKPLSGLSLDEARKRFGESSRERAEAWKQISPSEVERYNRIANASNEAKQAEYKQWVESHTPEEIASANRARKALRTEFPAKKNHKSKWPAIRDERQAKRRVSSFAMFVKDRMSSPDFHNISPTDRYPLMADEWKALSESEKHEYNVRGLNYTSQLNGQNKVEVHEDQAPAAAAAA